DVSPPFLERRGEEVSSSLILEEDLLRGARRPSSLLRVLDRLGDPDRHAMNDGRQVGEDLLLGRRLLRVLRLAHDPPTAAATPTQSAPATTAPTANQSAGCSYHSAPSRALACSSAAASSAARLRQSAVWSSTRSSAARWACSRRAVRPAIASW